MRLYSNSETSLFSIPDNSYTSKRNMRRGKPQQQIYRPGSGPLKKSTPGPEETESDTNLLANTRQNNNSKTSAQTNNGGKFKSEGSSPKDQRTAADVESMAEKMGDMSVRDGGKRNRKPEQPLYVPRAVQQARTDDRSDQNYQHVNGNYENNPNSRSSKRYSHRRRDSDSYDERRAHSPMHHQHHHHHHHPHQSNARNARQGSESRAQHLGNSNWGRMRDTKSVEPNYLPNRNYNAEREKVHSKPPSGRRHSTIGMENEKKMKIPNLELLPPRLRKRCVKNFSN